MTVRTGAQHLVKALEIHGVEHIFCVPGESFLDVLDALHDSPIELTVCRQEGGATMMAEAHGKLTGRPGICFVTRGPGATNASAGVHIAQQDSTPLILFVGQIPRGWVGREAFQEVDYRAFFGDMAKWVCVIDDPARVPELTARAFSVATSGRPGPVIMVLPEDMLSEPAEAPEPRPSAPVETYPGLNEMAALQKLLRDASRPLLVLGGSRWSERAVAAMQRFAERFRLPVATTFRRQMLFDSEHPCYAGDLGRGLDPKLAARVREADILLAVGTRLGEVPSGGYTLIEAPEPKQRLVHVYPDPDELGRVFRPTLAVNATPTAFAAAAEGLEPPQTIPWGNAAETAHADFLAWTTPGRDAGPVQISEIVAWLRAALPEEAILTNGAGNYAVWLHRYFRFRRYGTQLAPVSGSMGYAVPAAVGAKRLHPDRVVVAWAGDGEFLMTGQEFATAVQYELPVVVVVVNNGMYGTIRMHQEREHPGRVVGTDLRNPDFAAYARAFGGHGETVERTEDFAAAFERARGSGLPAIIEVRTDPEAIMPVTRLSAIREKARQAANSA